MISVAFNLICLMLELHLFPNLNNCTVKDAANFLSDVTANPFIYSQHPFKYLDYRMTLPLTMIYVAEYYYQYLFECSILVFCLSLSVKNTDNSEFFIM